MFLKTVLYSQKTRRTKKIRKTHSGLVWILFLETVYVLKNRENKENRENTFRACLVPVLENCFMFSKNKENKENRENTFGACLDPIFRNCFCTKKRGEQSK